MGSGPFCERDQKLGCRRREVQRTTGIPRCNCPVKAVGLMLKVLLPFLDKENERQIKEGIIPPSEIEQEDTKYPFSGD